MQYDSFERNHVILPGREKALAAFLAQDYHGLHHKERPSVSSHSEDALTWSCFDVLGHLPSLDKKAALDEILDDAFGGHSPLRFKEQGHDNDAIQVHVGRQYAGPATGECTEVDASIEAPGVLVFIEAKLYSAVAPASPPAKPHDQIARKLRVGLDAASSAERDFYFVFLDLAPDHMMCERRTKLSATAEGAGSYKNKWRSAWLFRYYKYGRNKSLRPLREILVGVEHPPVEVVASRMGWLTWADLFKCTLRAVLTATTEAVT